MFIDSALTKARNSNIKSAYKEDKGNIPKLLWSLSQVELSIKQRS